MTQLGLTARLLSPVLAVACTTGVVLDVQLHDLRWQDELGGAFPLSLGINNAPKQPTLTASCAVAVAFCDFLQGPIAELITTVGLVRPVSPMIMWGNVASVVDSAITLIRTHRSDLDSTARAIAQAMFSATPLRGTPAVDDPFRRRSCCLIYRIAARTPTTICGDCVLNQTTDH